MPTLDELLHAAVGGVGGSERPGQVDRHIGSTEKAERLLGWRARTAFAEGLERTIAWYLDNRPWWESILRNQAAVSSS